MCVCVLQCNTSTFAGQRFLWGQEKWSAIIFCRRWEIPPEVFMKGVALMSRVAVSMIHPNKSYFTSPEAHQSQLQFVHEDDLAAAFHTMVQHDLPEACNVVGDEPDSMPHIAAAAGLNVIEIPHEMIVQSVISSWQNGESVFGPEWVGGEGSLICSNEKLKAKGVWKPRYTTAEAYAATVEVVA